MNTVYRVKENVDINEFGKIGYDLIPNGGRTIIKIIEQPIDGELAHKMLEQMYENQQWKDLFYKKHKQALRDTLGLRYNKRTGKAILNEKFSNVLTKWYITIDLDVDDDRWIGFRSLDKFDTSVFYSAKEVLDKYCAEEIKMLKEKDFIEEIEVGE